MKKTGIQIFITLILTGCSLINNDNKLSDSDLKYIQNIGLLGENENVIKFSTSRNIKNSGNFITEKRLASYWIDKNENKSYKEFAYYSDIIKIDSTNNTEAWTYTSYLIITKNDNSTFKLYIDGDKEKYSSFLKLAYTKWEENK